MKISLPGRRSEHMRDQRAQGGASGGLGGGMGLPIGLGAGGGIGGIILVLVLVFATNLFGGGGSGFDVNSPFNQFPGAAPATGSQPLPGAPDPDAQLVDFVSFVLDDVQTFWDGEFLKAGNTYQPAELVLFTGATRSGCGNATSATGPFYCPADETAYLDISFFQELKDRFGAPGDFAQAYVIAHELGHHVQNLTGISDQVQREAQQNPDDANNLSVRQELQADCLAGVWGHSTYTRGILEEGDIEEGLTAANAIGDDRLQRQAGGTVDPDSFTHGTSEQRVSWFKKGFDTGDAGQCNTFSGDI
jgi:predicted metalloprotease